MIKRFNITRNDFRQIFAETDWGSFLRKFEIEKALCWFEQDHFDKALELGCGSGKHSKYLAFYCKKLIATEYDGSKLEAQRDEKIRFSVADAMHLAQFKDGEMDLIFSSNLLEHLTNPAQCLAECRRVVKQNGFVIHTIPNRTWKLFNVLLHYPSIIKAIFRRLFIVNSSVENTKSKISQPRLDDNLKMLKRERSLKRIFFPGVHGISKGHFEEFTKWGGKHWTNEFKRSGLEVINIVRLPFYFGHGYNLRILLRLGNYLGLSSCTAYILKKSEGDRTK